ncbi:TPA: YlcI/YnfO family protein [Klebsiella pneumoniae]|uniref:YlcI/YnfO family protein n=1 Tax=Klebsiella pneumoniae TaxID=573 RepID=UPI0021A73B7C|nr:YlcI/YnfO family protein [Klebsiella pneumoniae]MDZ3283502.1 hypothetical protein [Klebsiella pneumoniae]HBQ5433318.1 hypothetical protein [Klebsiella pneumoniae]HBS7410676.1 hypothetical protein [Klebsiella pneumoniae]HCA5430821.1 hypothetical protein [Klebsiella pneumoniae]HCB1372972.1 hypothetical protein [Klebsiella pneumoniae]
MATKAVNRKSQTIAARVPHEIAGEIENFKEPGESTGQFVVIALENEIKRRQRKHKKEVEKDDIK